MANPTISNTYVGDGSTVLFSFTFPYIKIADVLVQLDGVTTTEYTFANATTIQFNVAPADAAAITIYRSTDNSDLRAVFFPGSAIRARDLNDNFTQSLYVVQEATLNVDDATSAALQAVTKSGEADVKATQALADSAQASSDALAAANSASTAQSQVAAAEAAAVSADAAASQASTDASSAVSTANAADAKADQALDVIAAGPVASVNGQTGVVVLPTPTPNNVDLTILPTLPE